MTTKQIDEIFCHSCGKIVKRNAFICIHCGVRVASTEPDLQVQINTRNPKNYPGLDRKNFIASQIVMCVVVFALLALASKANLDLNKHLPNFVVPFAIFGSLVLVQIMLVRSRLRNMGSARDKILSRTIGCFIPLINLYFAFMLYPCQPGFYDKNKIDSTGAFIRLLMAGLMILGAIGEIFQW